MSTILSRPPACTGGPEHQLDPGVLGEFFEGLRPWTSSRSDVGGRLRTVRCRLVDRGGTPIGVKVRTRVQKGAGSKAAAVAMAFKLRDAARSAGGASTRTRTRQTRRSPPEHLHVAQEAVRREETTTPSSESGRGTLPRLQSVSITGPQGGFTR